MSTVIASRAAVINAPPERVYAIIADYENGHPSIVPEKYIGSITVEEGGVGDGTVIRFTLTTPGQTREVRARVTEPEPGRVIAETDVITGAVTRFIVDPLDAGQRCRVEIRTEWEAHGVSGWLQRLLAPPLLRKMYAEELANLERIAVSAIH